MTETPEALRARHLRLNVALRRLGYHMPACDGPQCPVCVALSDAHGMTLYLSLSRLTP